MATYIIGDMIHEARVKGGYSQEELSFGICSLSSLSRIENNLQVPSKKIFDALIEKLGVSDYAYNMYVSKEEMELYALSHKITRKLSVLDFENLEELTKEFEQKIGEKNGLDFQYLLFTKALIAKHKGQKDEEVLKLLMSALHLTMANFNIDDLEERRLITFAEISILNNIGMLYYEMGKKQEGLKILFWLVNHMDNHLMDEEEKAKKYPMILYNISKRIGDGGRNKDAYELSEKGVKMCIEYGKLHPLPYLMVNKGCAAAELGRKEEAAVVFDQAFSLFAILGKQNMLDKLKAEVKKRYNIHMS